MQPIHYSMTLGVITLFFGALIAFDQREPLLFVLSVLAVYLLGAQTVGQFGGGNSRPPEPESGDYQGTAAGFVQDDN